jgi:nicotinamide-nucleotide amidase
MLEPHSLVQALATIMQDRGMSLATAESCTGGLIAKLVTDLPGSSAWFDRGFVTYSNAAKFELLGVQEAVLCEHGAVSAETVSAMAEGALRHSHADISVAVSGVAGPEGGTLDKPVGLVWLAWCRRGQSAESEQFRFEGNRESVRLQAADAALRGLLRRLEIEG